MESGEWERLARAEHLKSLAPWRVCEQLSVFQAALLILKTDPAQTSEDEIDAWRLPHGFIQIFTALKGAILSGKLTATIRNDPSYGVLNIPPDSMAQFQEGGVQRLYRVVPDWYGTLIVVTDLREWLVGRGIKSEFFFPDGLPNADYLNPSDSCFSPKLYAAIAAWIAVKSDRSLTRTKSVKSALSIWLNQHAAQYGLTKGDGTPNKQAIEEVAKVANWVPKGGAPKTPK
jgi:hypothetical protein